MKLIENLAKLISVKSLTTLALVGVFCFLTVNGMDVPQFFSSVLLMVLSFYFGTQYQKKATEIEKGDDKDVS